ncbi:FHA domain-containing protein DDL [Ceratitis capitata]|uniref:Smad nuclear interacting protein 1 n=1 Tax=Ceratitis capitata TaxID=7213 RepID=W8C371_CERCA|nr:FHA domain-containing protein DDL [Ceratitis capitata]
MSKSKNVYRKGSSLNEEQSDCSEREMYNPDEATRHHGQRSLNASKAKKDRSEKNLKHKDSSNSSDGSTSESDSSKSSTNSIPHRISKTTIRTEYSNKRKHSEEKAKRRPYKLTHKRDHNEINADDEPNVSKWDSPLIRTRPRSRSRSRPRHRQRERSEERKTVRSKEDYYDRGNRTRSNYGRNYKEHYDKRREYTSNDLSARRNDRNDKTYSRSQHDDRVKREHKERSRQMNSPNRKNSRDNESGSYEWGSKHPSDKREKDQIKVESIEKDKPNFALSGALLEDTNKVNGIVVKYAEPPEARKPKRRWRLYPFKGETALPTLHIHRQSCFLVGRDRKVADLAVDHPSCSKQHAALQYRLVSFERDDGTQGKRVRLYLIDLESANGTFLNNKKIDPRKYYELIEKDVIKFGFSTREYVLLHENSKEDQEDDDVFVKPEPEDEPESLNP